MADTNENLETVTFDELEQADGASLISDDKLLIQINSQGVIKRVSFGGLFIQESTAREMADTLLQTQVDTQRNTFVEFRLIDHIPLSTSELDRHVLYLYNVVNDVYRGYYLIEGTGGNSIGELGGRTYTGGDGIDVNLDTAVITNTLVTSGGTLGGNSQIDGDLTVNGDIYQSGSSYETHAEKLYTKKDVIYTRDGAQSPLASGEYSGLIAKHYDLDGNDGALVFDRTGTARVGDYTENKTVTVYSYDGNTFYKTKTNVTVYSSDGITFYVDSGMTEVATIPSGVTPQLVSGNEYTYPALSNAVTLPSGVTPTATSEDYTYTYTADVDDTEPLLTRDEEANLQNNDIFIWDAAGKKAKKLTRPVLNNTVLTAQISSNGVDYQWKSGGSGSVNRFATKAAATAALSIPEGQDGYLGNNAIVIVEEEDSYIKGEEKNV